MVRTDALNVHVDPIITEMTGTQHIPISHVFLRIIKNKKGSSRTKTYCKSILQTRANKKNYRQWKFYVVERVRIFHKSNNTNKKYAIDEI